jgi:hypothetical protein
MLCVTRSVSRPSPFKYHFRRLIHVELWISAGVRKGLEVTLEKVMLTVIGLCFASMICVPLIENGVSQISDQYAYSQFQDLVSSIDSGINNVANGTGQVGFQKDVYIPRGVAINSSSNQITFRFDSSSMRKTVNREYPIAVNLSFNYPEGWYSIDIYLQNLSMVIVRFAPDGN